MEKKRFYIIIKDKSLWGITENKNIVFSITNKPTIFYSYQSAYNFKKKVDKWYKENGPGKDVMTKILRIEI